MAELITREEYESRQWFYDPKPLASESVEWAEEYLRGDTDEK